MAYRDDAGDILEAPTAEGVLRATVAPRSVALSVAHRTLHISGRFATLIEHHKKVMKEVVVHSRFGVTVWGDYVRFADPQGTDLAKVSIPWITPEDRRELARRIGQLVDRGQSDDVTAWPPHLAADGDRPPS